MKQLNHLSDLSNTEALSSFHRYVRDVNEKVQALRSNINLADESSICDGKKALLRIRAEFQKQYRQLEIDSTQSPTHEVLYQTRAPTIRAVRRALTSVYRHQIKISQNN